MRLIVLLFLFTALFPPIALGAEGDLYLGEAPVADQSQSAREAAFPIALRQVLSKLSGLRDPDAYAPDEEVLFNARSLVLSFFYEQRLMDSEEAGVSTGVAEEPEEQLFLLARFSQSGVDELMRVLGLPRWPPARESLGVWILIDDGLSRRVLPLEYAYLRSHVDRVADTRGLPLWWPQAGEDGDYGVDVQLLWGGYTETITEGGVPANVLVVAARREGVEWSTRQILEYEDQHWTWRNRNIDLGQALTDAMHQVVDEIAHFVAIAPSDQGNWLHEIVISGMTSGDDYARCLAYLESLSVVDEVVIRSADPAGVLMWLLLNAAPQHFEQAVAEGRVLESADRSGQYVLQR